MKEEIFAIIPDNYNYLIGNLGTVLRLQHSIIAKDGKVYNRSFSKRKIYRNGGYWRVEIKGTHYLCHRLIANAFIPNHENKKTINHIDGDGFNNSINNLEWATYSENNQHAYDFLGKTGYFKGKASPAAKRVGKYKNDELIEEYSSARSASIASKQCESYVSIAIRKNKECHGFKWKYL